MEENKKMETPAETTPALRPDAAAVVKEKAGLPAEVPQKDSEAGEVMKPVVMEGPEAEVEVDIIDDRDERADALIRWGAARAGGIVVAPLLGTVALIANEIYMISKIADVYGEKVASKSALAFLGSMGGTVLGNLAATLIPLPMMQMPIAISVTYGVGKAAKNWIKDGQPDNVKPYMEVFEEGKKEGKDSVDELENEPLKDQPLGDEKKDFRQEIKKSVKDFYPVKAHKLFDKFTDKMTEAVREAGNKAADTLRKAGVTDEQMEDAKFRAIAVKEIAQETAEETAKDLKAAAKIKSKVLGEEALVQAKLMKMQAREKMAEMKIKAEELKREARVREAQARERSAQAREAARKHMETARKQAEEVRANMQAQSEAAKVKADEVKVKITTKAGEYKDNASKAAEAAKANLKDAADDFLERVDARTAFYQEKYGTAKENKKEDL